jgi:adenylate cyclase
MGFTVVFSVLFLYASSDPGVSAFRERLEGLAYDFRLQYFLPAVPAKDPRIVIVDIDDKSLQTAGRWPWPRVRLADLIEQTASMGPAVIGLDMVLAEPEPSPLEQLQEVLPGRSLNDMVSTELIRLDERLAGDRQLAGVLGENTVVLGYTLASSRDASGGRLPEPIYRLSAQQRQSLGLPRMGGYLANIDTLQAQVSGAGFFLVRPDDDGVIRQADLLLEYDGNLYPSLSLAIMHQYFGEPPLELLTAQTGDRTILEGLDLSGALTLTTDEQGRVWIPFAGPRGSFHYLSAVDVMQGGADPELLRDAIVLIGTTAQGLHDLRATPVGAVYPGVEVHANLLLGMLEGSFPVASDWAARGGDFLVLAGMGTLLALWMPLLRPISLVLLTLGGLAGYLAVSFWFWHYQGIVLSQALPLLMLVLLGASNAAYGFLRETRDRMHLKSLFGQYVPPQIVEEMNRSPEQSFGFEGETRQMTVLFADIRSFTTISESLAADELKRMLNYFFTPMTGIIFNNRGTIDKYVGDMIMAFWGAPLEDPQHARNALIAALGMLDAVEKMQDELQRRGWPPIAIGIGLNSGAMDVGDMGSEFRRSYTVLGDAVNLGSRLEGLTKFYGVSLCVSEFTKAEVPDFAFRLLDKVQVKGKKEAIRIYEPIAPQAQLTEGQRQELAAHEQALDAYYAGDWQKARLAFEQLGQAYPQRKLYPLYIERIGVLQQQGIELPWDGVFTHTSK